VTTTARRVVSALLIPFFVNAGLWACSSPTGSDAADDASGDAVGDGGGGSSARVGGIPTYPPNTVSKARAPIKLPGGGGVSDGGTATYNLPLAVPAGPRGMQPDLALAYSGDGNSHLGAGWGLSGLSIIAPCRRTFAADGYADGVDRDGSDAYCLDGQRLVPPEQPYAPPAPAGDTLFHTEVETFIRVLAHPNPHGGPAPGSFTVYDREGGVAKYTPIHSHLLTNVHAHSAIAVGYDRLPVYYVLWTRDDKDGNRIRYNYEDADSQSSGDLSTRIRSIEYAFTDGAPTRRIDFEYEARPDPIIRYTSGIRTVVRSRIANIVMWAPNPTAMQKVWSYKLAYQTSADTKRSLLSTVWMYDQFGAESWWRSFAYSGASGGYTEHVTSTYEFDGDALSYSKDFVDDYLDNDEQAWIAPTDVRVILYDLDDDGDDDLLYRNRRTWVGGWSDSTSYPSEGGARWLGGFYSGTPGYGWKPGKIWLRHSNAATVFGSRHDVGPWIEPGVSDMEPEVVGLAHLGKSRVADTNFDGHLELVLASTRIMPTGAWPEIGKWNFDTWEYGFTNYSVDLDGYGVGPLDTVLMHGTVLRGLLPMDAFDPVELKLQSPPFQRVMADLDGDARVEPVEVLTDAGGIDTLDDPDVDWNDPFLEHPYGFGYHTTASSDGEHLVPSAPWSCNNGQMLALDVDGDGRQDVLSADQNVIEPTLGHTGVYRRIAVDDGAPGDAHGPVSDQDLTSMLWGGDCGAHDPDLVIGDWNGDGLSDALYPPGSYTDPNASPAYASGVNKEPLVRWNLGTGFGPIEPIGVNGVPWITSRMEQKAPTNKFGLPVQWDRGTRAADVNGDGRTDIIAFRQDNTACVDVPLWFHGMPDGWGCENEVFVYLSAGDHFEGQEIWSWSDAGASLSHGFTTAQVGDVNGDGALDVVHVAGGKLRALELPWRVRPDQLTTVQDGSSAYALETFERSRAWWGETDRPEAPDVGPPCAWPVVCGRRGFEVVRRHQVFTGTRPDGTPMHSTDIHTYQGPRASMLGRGSLGFNVHKVWNRERGVETTRVFENLVTDAFGTNAFAPDMALPFTGSLFFTLTGTPSFEMTITPLTPTPLVSDLSSTSAAPGLVDGDPIPVHIVTTTRTFELRSNASGRQLTRLPLTTNVTELDNQRQPSTSSATPYYYGSAPGGDQRRTETTYTHDALGNPTDVTTVIRTGAGFTVRATRRTTTAFVSCPGAGCPDSSPDAWITGLPVRIANADYDLDDLATPAPPTRVLRLAYDTSSRLQEAHVNAAGPSYQTCAFNNPNPESCESRAETIAIAYEPVHGNPTSVTVSALDVATPRTTTTTWDADGVYPMSQTDAAGISTVRLIHPGLGVPILALDENNVLSVSTYDGFRRPLSTVRSGAPTLTRSYTAVTNGNRRGIRIDTSATANGASSVTTDELGRTIEGKSLGFGANQWIYASREYDALGNVATEMRPAFALGAPVTTFDYDRLGRTTKVIPPNGAVTRWTHAMFETNMLDPQDHATYVKRDIEGRPIETGHLVGGQPYGEVKVTYGVFDLPSETLDVAGNKVIRTYDAFGRPASITDPDAGPSTFLYNGFGETVSHTTPSGTTLNMYDVLGRLVQRIDSQGKVETRAYDAGPGAKRRLVSATSGDGVVTNITYDALGRTFQLAQTLGATTHQVVHRYDSYGRLVHLFYPTVSGMNRFALNYTYNANGYLRAILDVSWCNIDPNYTTTSGCLAPTLWEAKERDALLGLTRATLGNSLDAVRSFDPDTGNTTMLSFGGVTNHYVYDLDGQLRQRTQDSRVEDFDYDDLHRLTAWTLQPPKPRVGDQPPPTDTTYEYTELGDLYRVKAGAVETFFGTFGGQGAHSLDSATINGSPTSYVYDDRGRQLSGGGRSTAWTDQSLPASITTASGVRTFKYSASGDRAERTSPGEKVTYVGQLYEHRDLTAGTRDTFYVYGDPGVVAQVDYAGGVKETRYVVNDPLGSTAVVMKGSGIVEKSYFDPFGARVDENGAPTTDSDPRTSHGFTGHEEDGGGVINMRGRIYDRAQFRFLTPDPIIADPYFGQAYNPYGYVYNNPTNLIDPSGYSTAGAGGAGEVGSVSGPAPPPVAETTVVTPPVETPTEAGCDPQTGCGAPNRFVSGTSTDDGGAGATPDEVARGEYYDGKMCITAEDARQELSDAIGGIDIGLQPLDAPKPSSDYFEFPDPSLEIIIMMGTAAAVLGALEEGAIAEGAAVASEVGQILSEIGRVYTDMPEMYKDGKAPLVYEEMKEDLDDILRMIGEPPPEIGYGEIKSEKSLKKAWSDVNNKTYQYNPGRRLEAAVTYDEEGYVRMRVRQPDGFQDMVYDDIIGQVKAKDMPIGSKYGDSRFGTDIEPFVIEIVGKATGQDFWIKHGNATGADLLPIE
jgi:RHS repeat-associated protein